MASLVFLNSPVYQMSNILLTDRRQVDRAMGGSDDDGVMVVALSPSDFKTVMGSALLTVERDMVHVVPKYLQTPGILHDMLVVLTPIFGEALSVDTRDATDVMVQQIATAGFVDVDPLHSSVSWKDNVSYPVASLAVSNAVRTMMGQPCQVTLIIDVGTQNILRDLVNLPVEMSGDLQVIAYTKDPMGKVPAIGVSVFDSGSVQKGDAHSVGAPDGLVSFHTHPVSSAAELNYHAGWPSNIDMSSLLTMKNLIHVVVAEEGLWTMARTLSMQRLTKVLTDAEKDVMRATAFNLFLPLNELRVMGTKDSNNKSLETYFEVFEKFTIGALMKHSGVTPTAFVDRRWLDDTIYYMGFIPWGRDTRFVVEYDLDGTNPFLDTVPTLMSVKRKARLQEMFDNMVSRMVTS
ncbi:hypothetical protein [Lumpfish ranavirus]|uniref:Uncharacterized protein n=1 Tax=Lumpfish ranavirus TaxID=2501771 RepID=A0A3Q9T8G4_9VIRU|nr:hypothetical protein [Lumpfish ranavirus]